MNSSDKLRALRGEDPATRMARLLTERAMAEAIGKMDLHRGEPGKDGKTPKKGEDYFTPAEIEQLVRIVQSRIKPAEPGRPGAPGKDAVSPVRGLHFWTKADQEAIIREVLGRVPKLELPTMDHAAIAEGAVQKVLQSKKWKIEDIDGLPKSLASLKDFLQRGGFRGGGASLLAGSNVTVTQNADGSWTISSTGGSGFTTLAATETPNGVLTVFTFAAAAAQPTYLVVDNVWMKAISKAGTVNWTWNGGTKKATLSVAAQDDIWGVV